MAKLFLPYSASLRGQAIHCNFVDLPAPAAVLARRNVLRARNGIAPPLLRPAACEFVQLPGALMHPINQSEKAEYQKKSEMLWMLFIVMLALWLLGVVSSLTFGGFIHILLVLAVLALVFQLLTSHTA